MIFDPPLFWLIMALNLESVVSSPSIDMTFVTVFGTLMYLVVGAGIGWALDWIRSRFAS